MVIQPVGIIDGITANNAPAPIPPTNTRPRPSSVRCDTQSDIPQKISTTPSTASRHTPPSCHGPPWRGSTGMKGVAISAAMPSMTRMPPTSSSPKVRRGGSCENRSTRPTASIAAAAGKHGRMYVGNFPDDTEKKARGISIQHANNLLSAEPNPRRSSPAKANGPANTHGIRPTRMIGKKNHHGSGCCA